MPKSTAREPVKRVADGVSSTHPVIFQCIADAAAEVKCSGDVPRCANCQASGLSCVYEQARRDRLREYA